jgi:hypothetical protein
MYTMLMVVSPSCPAAVAVVGPDVFGDVLPLFPQPSVPSSGFGCEGGELLGLVR